MPFDLTLSKLLAYLFQCIVDVIWILRHFRHRYPFWSCMEYKCLIFGNHALIVIDVAVLPHLFDEPLLAGDVFHQVFWIAASGRPANQAGNVSRLSYR